MPKAQTATVLGTPKKRLAKVVTMRKSAVLEWRASAALEGEAHRIQRKKLSTYLRHSFPALLAYAQDIWQNDTDALEWFLNPHSELQAKVPASLLESPEGEKRVMNLLVALDHGFPV